MVSQRYSTGARCYLHSTSTHCFDVSACPTVHPTFWADRLSILHPRPLQLTCTTAHTSSIYSLWFGCSANAFTRHPPNRWNNHSSVSGGQFARWKPRFPGTPWILQLHYGTVPACVPEHPTRSHTILQLTRLPEP